MNSVMGNSDEGSEDEGTSGLAQDENEGSIRIWKKIHPCYTIAKNLAAFYHAWYFMSCWN
jgi:hypothetical protein